MCSFMEARQLVLTVDVLQKETILLISCIYDGTDLILLKDLLWRSHFSVKARKEVLIFSPSLCIAQIIGSTLERLHLKIL